ncbi:TetR/AcrR family transcriptional regulator [Streptomyces sp. NPDC048297]|uniref:TetR/AcrR family transcriptional regulator n=1 Tax=Streptomyces sp. NPDC048297 TaxID=3365531 RepID=UPI003719EB75
MICSWGTTFSDEAGRVIRSRLRITRLDCNRSRLRLARPVHRLTAAPVAASREAALRHAAEWQAGSGFVASGFVASGLAATRGGRLSTTGERRRRSDARTNQERLVAAAARAFTRDGTGATLKAIAQDAGVGIGTLYRHFPTRQALVEAVYRSETQRLCDAVPELLRQLPPVEALRAWAAQFLEYMATKDGMADVLHGVLSADEGLQTDTRTKIDAALGMLVDAGKRTGDLRGDLDIEEVALALGGFVLIVERRSSPQEIGLRLVDLLLQGLTRH